MFGRIKGHLLAFGRAVGERDVLIAPVALSNGQALVAQNPRPFGDMPALSVLSYG